MKTMTTLRDGLGIAAALGVAGWLGSTAAVGQGANPAGASPATPGIEAARPAPDVANTQDQLFLRQAAIGNSAEVELGQLAAKRAGAQSVKDFAARMTADHRPALEKLAPFARSSNTPLPRELDMDHKVVRDQLSALNGSAFDVAYIRAQIVDHQRTVQLLQWQMATGQHEGIKAYSRANLPVVLEHLEMAKGIHAELTGAAP